MPTSDIKDRFEQALGSVYAIQRELKGGAMSRVFVAEERALGRLVVIKVLALDPSENMSAERFELEIKLVASLQNPHIVPLFSAGSIDGLPYYTMPYIEGESLRAKLVRESSLTAFEATQLLRDVGMALEYAHAHGVIHRDIKPDNILLSGSSACVADFGIARALTAARTSPAGVREGESRSAITRHGMAVGTPAYMSPEQATAAEVDQRTDIYSLGCVAFELLTGKPPFTKQGAQALIVAHVVEPPPIARLRQPSIPTGFAELVRACLEKSPSDRPASASEFLSALESAGVRSRTATPRGHDGMASIAVLPFENMSGDKDTEFFSDGISEDIINALTQISGLRVAGRMSSFAFKGKKVDLAKVREKLNVETVLEGSVRKAGNRLRITAQLVTISDGYHLWSERFDRELTDIFAVQDEIATAIASKLKLSMNRDGELSKPPTSSVEAYELFLKGRPFYYIPGRRMNAAIGCFEGAIALDDTFALAHAALADALTLSGYYGAVKPVTIIERAHQAALRAVELSPGVAESHHALALWMTFYGGDRNSAMREWENLKASRGLGIYMRCSRAVWGVGLLSGQWEEAVEEIRAAIGTDPLNGFAHSMLAMMKTFAGQLDDVVAFARRGIELDPTSFWSHLTLQRAFHCAGMGKEAETQGLQTLEISGRHPWVLAELAVHYRKAGNVGAATAIHDELAARGRVQHLQASPLALAAVAAGRLDEAIDLCKRAVAERDAHILWAVLEVWDGWQPIYEHPQWKDVRKGIFSWRPLQAVTPARVS
ncbi:MAG: protein kinase domain-containing protein [Gemmatimonadaceae bacterium]